jgi:tetratricopeptide (TPR) repeat protein
VTKIARNRFSAFSAVLCLAIGCGRGERAVVEAGGDAKERALVAAARARPGEAAAQEALGAHLLSERRPHAAIWALQDALDLRPEDAEVRRQIARALVAAHLPRQALRYMVQSRSADGASAPGATNVEDRRVAAAAYLAMADTVGAVGMLVTAGAGLDAAALLDLGNAHEAMGDDRAAAAAYGRHLEAAPESAAGYLALARVAARLGQQSEAAAALARARALAPDDPRVLVAASPDAQDAEALLRRTLAADPAHGPAHLRLGLHLLRQGRAPEAVPHLQAARDARAGEETRLRLAEALAAAGKAADAAYERGVYFLETGEPRRALAEFTRLAQQEPDRSRGDVMIATAYARLEQPARAADVAARGLERRPDDPDLLALRAKMLIRSDARDEAATLCRHWAERFPAAAEPYVLLAAMERAALRFAEAAQLAEAALQREPENADACLEAARALASRTPPDLTRAIDLLKGAARRHPEDARLPLQLAPLLIKTGDLEGARREYLRALDLDPASRAAALGIAQLCPQVGKGPRAAFYAEIVRALQERGDAARLLAQRLDADPRDADALARLARLHLEAGDLARAHPLLARAARARPNDRALIADLQAVERILAMRQSSGR